MKTLLPWLVALGLPALVLSALWTARLDPDVPNFVLPTQMAYSPAYQAQSPNPVLPAGATQQLPPEGTLARGARAFHYGDSDEERARAGRELVNPVAPTEQALAKGKRLYEDFCQACHGSAGAGDGPVIPKFPNPPDFRTETLRALADGEIFHTITLGKGSMAPHDHLLGWEERWRVVHYLRQLQEGRTQ